VTPGPCFEDFDLGQVRGGHPPRVLTSGDVALYLAFTGDRTWMVGPDTHQPGPVHPLLLFHLAFGQTVPHVSANARANLGYAEMIWHRPVEVGEAISTDSTVIGLKENRSGKDGIVWVRSRVRVGDDVVLSWVRWVMVRKQGTARTPWFKDPVRPDLAAAVSPTALGTPPRAPSLEGARQRDYAPGDTIDHPARTVVTTAEHRMFTRHALNNAQVHFDETPDRPSLVYGGYVWSMAYAAAYSGFPARTGIAAVNSGQHARPVFAGDTLYAQTRILAVDRLDDGAIRAVRCRLLVGRNQAPDPQGESVVLDLDFWERVAT